MTEATAASPFDAIIAELVTTAEEINKSQADMPTDPGATEDDEAIAAAAAAETATDGKAPEGDGAPMEKSTTELGKSFTVTLADGTEGEAVDATELLKALVDRVEVGEVKTVDAIKSMLGVVKSQGDLIKSLSDQVSTLANSGRRRASVVTITEKPAAAIAAVAPAADGISVDEFWGKAFAAQTKGAISSVDIAKIEFAINHNQQPPEEILARISRSLAA